MEHICYIWQQAISSDHPCEQGGSLLVLAEGKVNLAEQGLGCTERNSALIARDIRDRKHRAVDDFLKVSGDECVHLLLRTASGLQGFIDRQHMPRYRDAAPDAVHIEVRIGPEEQGFRLVLLLEAFVEVRLVNPVQDHVAAIDAVVEIRPGILKDTVGRLLLEIVYVIAVLRACRRGADIQVVTPVFAKFGIDGELALEFCIAADDGDIEVRRRLVHVFYRNLGIRRKVEELLAGNRQRKYQYGK